MNYLTVKEFAEKMKLNPYTVRKNIREGYIYAFRPASGKKSGYRIPETEIERLQVKAKVERENDTRRT